MKLFEIKFRKLLSWKLSGAFRSFFKWEWLDVEDFRPYHIWDEVKHINWKISAKHGNLFIKLFKQEKDTQIHIFFDLNSNWNAWELSVIKEKAFGFFSDLVILSRSWNANILWFYNDEKLKIFEVKTNFQKASYFISKVDKFLETISNKYISNLWNFLKHQKSINKRHIIVIVSDFLDLNEENIKTIKLLSEKNEVMLVKFDVPNFVGLNYDNFVWSFDKNKNSLKFWELESLSR